MSSSEYSYNAPQYYANFQDVASLTDDEDDFFDAAGPKDKEPDEVEVKDQEDKENVIELSDEESLNESFSKIKIKNKFDGIDLAKDDDRKSHPMLTRQDVTILSPKLSLELRSRSVLKDLLITNESRLNKKRKAESSPSQGNSVAKYRSLAEAIYHFQKDTPPRFRGVSKKSSGFRFSHQPIANLPVTVPETPHFLSENRLRHCSHHYLTAEEKELEEIEKAKQSFKPQQLNKKIFEQPQEVVREKQFTIPKPFKLTQPPVKKPEEETNEVFVFKAKPMPQRIYRSMDNLRVSTNRLPILMEEEEVDDCLSSVVRGFKEAVPSKKTQIKPFSFDERDKLIAKRKLAKIEKILEEEKMATVFKAQPLPSYLATDSGSPSGSVTSSVSSYHRHEIEELNREFKARPADVLHRKPFQVKRSERTSTKFLDVKLNTEIRAQQRFEFNEQIKAHQLERNQLDAKMAEEEAAKAQEEVAQLRKELVHKPLPVPKASMSDKHSSEESLVSNDS